MKRWLAVPVVVYEGGGGAISECEGVLGSLIPLNIVNAVRAVVVARNNNATDQLLGTLVVEVLCALLIDHVPEGQTAVMTRLVLTQLNREYQLRVPQLI